MSSEERDEERRKRESDEKNRQEEHNTRRRCELVEKYKGCPYLETNKARRKSEEKDVIELVRTERLAIKEQRKRSSLVNNMPQFTVRRKSITSDALNEGAESSKRSSTVDPTIYFPRHGIRRSIVEDITPGGSRRATEPLKAQLMEIISNMSQTSIFKSERRYSNIVSSLHPKPKGQDRASGRLDTLRSPDRSGTSSPIRGTLSPQRLPPADLQTFNAQYNYDEGVENVLVTTPQVTTTTPAGPEANAKQIQMVPTATSPHQYHVYDYTDVSTSISNTPDTHEPISNLSSSNASNTIRLPSNSSEMRAGRTAEFLNEGWYHNVYYNDTNDEFNSVLASSARQMKVPAQQIQNMQSIQHIAGTGPIICDQCRYSTQTTRQPSQPCCSGMAQTMPPMESYSQQGPRGTTAIQCNDVCPKRNSILQTIARAIKNPITRSSNRRSFDPTTSELYRLNITEGNDYQGFPKRVIFDLINGEMCKPPVTTVGTNTQIGIGQSPLIAQMGIVQPGGSNKLLFNPNSQNSAYLDQQNSYNTGAVVINHPQGGDQPPKKPSKICALKHNLQRHQERIDVYYFDHGNASYYRTTDSPGTIYTELIAERIEHNSAQYWAELFGTIHIAFSLFTAFFLQLYRFVLQSTFRPIVVGFVQLTSDYMLKPLLALIFNALIQPLLIYLYNIATSFRDLCEPIADAFGFFLREIAVPIRAFRLVEVKQHRKTRPYQVL